MTAAVMHASGRVAVGPVGLRRGLLAAALAALSGELAMVLMWHTQDRPEDVAWDIAVTVSWVAVGWIACLLRPQRRIGHLMLVYAAVSALVGPAGLGLQDHGWLSSVAVTVGYALVPFQTPLAGHLLLAFPSGRLSKRSHRRLIGVGYGYAAITSIGLLLTLPRQAGECSGTCAENLANLVPDPGIHATAPNDRPSEGSHGQRCTPSTNPTSANAAMTESNANWLTSNCSAATARSACASTMTSCPRTSAARLAAIPIN
jgi:hypothetical protein